MKPELERAPGAALSLRDFAEQGALYEGLIRTLRDGSYVHAYLISGPAGIGKRSLAHLMAQGLLCTAKDVEKPCGACPSCQQVRDGNHPDVLEVRVGGPLCPSEDAKKKDITVGQMRNVVREVGQHSFVGGCKVVIVEEAEKMNRSAANAFLKTLEEPPEGTVFLLLTDKPEMLLDTIVSRCRPLKMHPWRDEYVLQVLTTRGMDDGLARRAVAVCGGSIGRAMDVAGDEDYWKQRHDVMQDFFGLASRSDILTVSGAWKDRKDDADALLDDVEDLLRMLMLVRLGRQDEAMLQEFPQQWQSMAASAPLESFINLMDAVTEARRLRSNNVTWQPVLERLLLRMMEEKSKW
ncbi:MAG: DNA polymerase III subunit delta' [Clostridia bacterium]|nr:DNA polymerase III subunit delta' [Clostridia bacterium]